MFHFLNNGFECESLVLKVILHIANVYGFHVCSSIASPDINAIFNEAERRQNI